jgi:hypothetical protein
MTKLKKSTKNYLKSKVKATLAGKMKKSSKEVSTVKQDRKPPAARPSGGGGGGRKPASGKAARRKPSGGGGGGKKMTPEEHDGKTDELQDDGYNLGILSDSGDDSDSDISESFEKGQEVC